MSVEIVPLTADDREQFITDNQEAFNYGALEEFGCRDDHFEEDRQIISRKTFDEVFSVKQTPADIKNPYCVGSWLYDDWFGHEGAMRTDQRANLKTGHSRVFFIQTENKAGSAFFALKKDWNAACDEVQGTPPFNPGN